MKKTIKIGVFDSGVGGIYVLGELTKKYNNFAFIYYGDNKNTPYGNKSKLELEVLLDRGIKRLIDKNVDLIVVACNTLSTNFYNAFDKYKIPVIPILPPKIQDGYLLCTKATFESAYVKENFKENSTMLLTLAKEIEDNVLNLEKVKVKRLKHIVPTSAKSVILGCTHYLFLKEQIQNTLDKKVVTGIEGVIEKIDAEIKNFKPCKNLFLQKVKFIGPSKRQNTKVFKQFFGQVVKKIKKN